VCAVLIMFIPAQSFMQGARRKKQHISTQQLEVVGSIWKETLQGWTFIRGNKQLFLAVIQLSFAGVLLLVIGELATPIVTKLLLLSPDAMAFIFAPAGIGLVAGSVVMPRITTRMGKSRAIITGSIAVALVALFLPFSTIIAHLLEPHGWNTNPLLLIIVALLMFSAGVALDFINIPAQTAIQQQTPDWIKGRVLALQLMLYNAFAIPIILFIGAFADIFGLDRVLYLMAVCILIFGLWGIYYERRHPNVILSVKSSFTEPEPDTVTG
ncbi:MAG: MFS transporter, partial [Ktedonobacteraceae bacterium]